MAMQKTMVAALKLAPGVFKAAWQSRRGSRVQQLRHLEPRQLAAWLAIPDAAITAVSWENVHAGTSSRSRLRVSYREDAPGLPRSFFVKTAATHFGTRVFGNLFALGRNEVGFYRSIRPGLRIRAPQIYYIGDNSSDFILLLEDLLAADCTFSDSTSRCSPDQAMSAMRTLAGLHAQFWQSPRLQGELAWVSRYETNTNQQLLTLLREMAFSRAINKYPQRVPDAILAAIPLILKKYPQLEQRWAKDPRTLIHGDAHIGNMYFQAGEVGLLDWQVLGYGQGMRDVSYFLVNSVPTQLRRSQQENLIKHYIDELAVHGVSLSFDEAWQQYRSHTAYTLVSSVVTAASSHMQQARIAAAGIARSCRAVIDLETIALIEAL